MLDVLCFMNLIFYRCVLNRMIKLLELSFCFRLLHSDRDPIPDVPAVYFVLPTEENVQRICQVSLKFAKLLLL